MSFDSGEFRNALGTFTTGICVVTTHSDEQIAYGMTINSFTSVSLNPPLVLWSLQDDSDCLNLFKPAQTFVINVLAADQQLLSSRYATKDNHQLDSQHYRIGKMGAPVIRGALASFECRRWAQYPGGDHLILVGEVVSVESNNNKKPLVFSSGQYRELR